MNTSVDPITFAVIKSGLDTIVDDMAYAVMRTARSPIVRDVLDYSVTICDRKGRILSQAKTVALHLGAVPDAMDVVLDRFRGDLFPGDVIVLNDPYAGGMHLPDIFMFKPIFSAEQLLGFSVVIAHHCDFCTKLGEVLHDVEYERVVVVYNEDAHGHVTHHAALPSGVAHARSILPS